MSKFRTPTWLSVTTFPQKLRLMAMKHIYFIGLVAFWLWTLYAWDLPATATGPTLIIIKILESAFLITFTWHAITTFIRFGVLDNKNYIGHLTYDLVKLVIYFNITSRFLVTFENIINDVIEQVIKEPQAAISMLIALFVAFWLYRMAIRKPNGTTPHTEYGLAAVSIRRSKTGLKLTAVHECGHALVYALQKKYPDIMQIGLSREIRNGEVRLGFMKSSIELDGRFSRDQLYWRMLLTLGGSAAEQAVYGNVYEGALEDIRMWQDTAERYLKNGFGDVLMPDDSNDESLRHNIAAFNTLHAEQRTILSQLMNDNVMLLKEMADQLLTSGTLETEVITDFLNRVIIPKTVPVFE